jgi:hypothetical protein
VIACTCSLDEMFFLTSPAEYHRPTPSIIQPPPVDVKAVKKSIADFVTRLRPKLKVFLSNFRLPIWEAPPMVDEDTKRFYRTLRIPCIKDNQPNLLLHDLGKGSNPYADNLFCNEHR